MLEMKLITFCIRPLLCSLLVLMVLSDKWPEPSGFVHSLLDVS